MNYKLKATAMVWVALSTLLAINGLGQAQVDEWSGLFSDDWDTTTSNWATNGVKVVYNQGDSVLFTDGARVGTVDIVGAAPYTPFTWTVTNNLLVYVFSGANSVSGTCGLVKSGVASLTLADGGDSFNGGITVNAGTVILDEASNAISGGLNIASGATVQVGNNDANGSLPAGAITDNGNLVFSQNFVDAVSTPISGSGSLMQNGSGTLQLTGNNTYSGNTVVLQGTLALSSGGSLTSTNFIVSHGTVDVSQAGGEANACNLHMTNGAITVGAAIVDVSGLNLGGSSNTLNIAALPGFLVYPTNATIIQSAGGITGYNLKLGKLPVATPSYAGSITTNGNSVLLALTSGPLPAIMTNFAGQGAIRLLYTVPNSTFIENPSGDSDVTINDTSGSVSTLQTLINNARSANPASIIIIHLSAGATYWVNNTNGGLVLGSQECLIGSGAVIEAVNSAVTNALLTIGAGSTNVSVAGGTFNGNGANVYCLYAPSSSARVEIDKVTALNCGRDCIQLNGQGDTTYDNEMTVTRCDVSGSSGGAGICISNATQAVCVDDNCHGNVTGIRLGNCGDSTVANDTCNDNTTGIDVASGNENNIANNTCNNNGTGILEADSDTMVASDLLGNNTVAGINSTGSGNFFIDNLFITGNFTNFTSAGSGNYVVPYQGALSASGQNYFYPPLISNQHMNTIVNGLGRYDLTNSANTTVDAVQSLYNAAISANPGDIIVLHLNGTYTVGAKPLTLYSDTCVLLDGEIKINSSTAASTAIQATNPSQVNISISGGTIDGGNQTGNNAININGAGMVQVDGMTLQNFGPDNPREGGSDVVHLDGEGNGGTPPYIVTRCTINGGAARGIWSQNDGIRCLYSENTVSNVNMDGVDCDSGTSGALVKFNNLSGNVRYGVFFEQRDKYDCAIGNVCNNDGRDLNDYNNDEPGSPVEYNSDICNSCTAGGNGMRSGSTGPNGGSDSTNTLTEHNLFFDNVAQNTSGDGIEGDQAGRQNYYSDNYLAGNKTEVVTNGSEAFFNPPDVSGYTYVQDSNSGLNAVVTNASASSGAAIILGPTNSPNSGQWSLIPTDSGYFQLTDRNSGLDMAVNGASNNAGALIIQAPFGTSQDDQWMPVAAGNGLYYLQNRHSKLYLDVPGASTTAGTQLDQQTFTGGANQQFSLIDAAVIPTPPTPHITGIKVSGTTLTITATNGADGGQFVLLGSANLLLPLSQWTPILTNNFDGNGNLNLVTNVINRNNPLEFYILWQ